MRRFNCVCGGVPPEGMLLFVSAKSNQKAALKGLCPFKISPLAAKGAERACKFAKTAPNGASFWRCTRTRFADLLRRCKRRNAHVWGFALRKVGRFCFFCGDVKERGLGLCVTLYAPFNKVRGVGKPAAERAHEDKVAFFQLARAVQLVECNRDACTGCIAVVFNVDGKFI